MVEIKWKTVVIGLVLAVIISSGIEWLITILFGMYIGLLGNAIGFLIATSYVGYKVGGDYKNGAIHGAIVGIFMGIIVSILGIILGVALGGAAGAATGLLGLIALLIYAIIGAIGGIIGVLIKDRRLT